MPFLLMGPNVFPHSKQGSSHLLLNHNRKKKTHTQNLAFLLSSHQYRPSVALSPRLSPSHDSAEFNGIPGDPFISSPVPLKATLITQPSRPAASLCQPALSGTVLSQLIPSLSCMHVWDHPRCQGPKSKAMNGFGNPRRPGLIK